MAFVLDASVTACWAFRDENHPRATSAFSRIQTEEAIVPSLWWFEIRNTMITAERRKRMGESDTASFLRYLSQFPVRTDLTPDGVQVLRLARAHQLSVYDVSYLELALREGVALATLDAKLAVAARAEGVTLIGEPS